MKGNKTDVLSFDDALNKHKRILTESLVNFNEGHRVRKILLDVDSNSADYEYYFQCGQQSKQAEIDELQKRIDLALNKIYFWVSSENGDAAYVANSIGSILKGDQ